MSDFSLTLKAGEAFGSGGHPSTQGALMALESLSAHAPQDSVHTRPPPYPPPSRLKRIRVSGEASETSGSKQHRCFEGLAGPKNILDIGCGSGVLALTAAHLWPQAKVLAADIAPEAVEFTLENARENGLETRVRAVRADGYNHAGIAAGTPYDLVLCNVLAEVIIRLASELARHQRPGGIAVLSGILMWHEQSVREAHEAVGYKVLESIPVNDWRTLVLEKKG